MGNVDFNAWQRITLSDGVILCSPDGAGRIQIRPRVGASYKNVLVGTKRIRLVTDEGELACAAASNTDDRVAITAVAGCDPQLCIEAIGVDPSIVVDLIRRCGLGLGRNRRRMFEYTPPKGWHGIRRHNESRWLHPTYPRLRSVVTVFDASPMTATPSAKLDRLLYMRMDDDGAIETPQDPESIEGTYGLSGRIRSARAVDREGNAMTRQAVAFSDVRYLYQASLEAPADDLGSLRAFDILTRSFRPLPQPTTRCATAALSHWAE